MTDISEPLDPVVKRAKRTLAEAKVTARDVKKTVQSGRDAAPEVAKRAKKIASDQMDSVKTQAAEQLESARQLAQEQLEMAREIAEAQLDNAVSM